MSSVEHILLYCSMFLLAVLYEKEYSACVKPAERLKRNTSLPFLSLLLCAVYVFTEGLRYGRGVDQLGNYGPFYLHCTLKSAIEDRETLFVWLNQIVHSADLTIGVLPFGIIFIVFALIFWCCLWQFYKDYRKESKYFLLLAILATNYITEWTIRQGVSFSFILLALYFLERKKWKPLAICVIMASGIHHGNILSIIVLAICHISLKNKPIPWKLTIPLFVILEYFASMSVVAAYIQDIAYSLNVDTESGNLSHYMDANFMERELEMTEQWHRGAFTQLITVLFYSSILYLGNVVTKIYSSKCYIYNAFVIGIMIFEPFRLAGSTSRAFLGLAVLWFVPLSMAFFIKSTTKTKKIYNLSLALSVAYILMYYGRYVFLNPEAKYVWNI